MRIKYNIRIPEKLRLPVYYILNSLLPDKTVMDLHTPKIVSHEHKFIYVRNPLVASSSFQRTLQEQYDCKIEQFELNSNPYEDYFVFSFVRNPLTRTITCYNKLVLNNFKIGLIYRHARYPGLFPGMTFSEFVNWLNTENGSDEYADRHWLSQHKILDNHCDFIGKLENIEEDLSKLNNILELNIKLRKKNESIKKPKKPIYDSYRDYYNKDLIEKVYVRYREDFRFFSYEKAI